VIGALLRWRKPAPIEPTAAGADAAGSAAPGAEPAKPA
jgi:hypothetical protein